MQPNADPSTVPVGLHRDALRDLPAAAVIVDGAHRVVFANAAFETLTGYRLAHLLQEDRRILQGADADPSLREALDRGRPFRGEVVCHREDGTALRCLLSVAPIRSALTTVTHFVGVVLDVADEADRPRTTEPAIQEAEPPTARSGQGRPGSGHGLEQLDADLRGAVDRGEIVAWFQPQYDARTGHLSGYEALARWHHPEHGILPPDRFIPLAEAGGLITGLGGEILEQACRFADLAAADRPLQMQVNVSVEQLRVHGLADRVRRVLAEYPDRPWSLNVEITESALILDHGLALVQAELEQLRDLGVGVSIDDFGSGYSSLSQLRDLPATELKIDRSFVHREDAIGTSLLTAIVALADGLGLLVVAEGVETRSQLARVRALGCDRLQGMYLCSPLSPEEALTARPDIVDLVPAAD